MRRARGRRTVLALGAAALGAAALGAAAALAGAGRSARAQLPAPARAAPSPAYVHASWTVRDGLPVNGLTAVLQSRDGYIWVTTWDGIVRFDGARFVVFNTGNSDALPSNQFLSMAELPDGTLFFVSAQGHLVRWRAGVFTHVREDAGLPDASSRVLYVDPAGRLYVGTVRGVLMLAGERFVPVAPSVREATDAILRDADGSLWIGTDGAGLFHVRGTRVVRYDTAAGLASPRVRHLAQARDGTVWVGTLYGLGRVRGARVEMVGPSGGPSSQAEVLGIVAPPENAGAAPDAVWTTMVGGIYAVHDGRLHPIVERAVLYGVARFAPNGTLWYSTGDAVYAGGRRVLGAPALGADAREASPGIRALAWDREGSVWLATNADGLYRLKPSPFTVYSVEEGVAARTVLSVLEDRSGAMWFGLNGGTSRLADGVVSSYTTAGGYPRTVLSLLEARNGDVWLGTQREGVRRCRVPAMACEQPPAGQPTGETTVRALYEDAGGDLWAGTEQGLFVLHGRAWRRVEAASAVGTVRFFLRARDGTLWMATDRGGLLAYRNGRFSSIGVADGLPSDQVRGLYEDPRGRIWVGTEGRGLARLTPVVRADGRVAAADIRTVRQRDGLFDEVIHEILPDDAGRLWMGTNRGIFWVRADELDAFADGRVARVRSTSYTERDGLRNREANGGEQPAGVRARDGRLWFATQDGAVVVDPTRVGRNSVPPPVLVEQVRTRDAARALRDGRVALAADERSFEVDYTALSFVAPENVRFRYRLDGLDDGWVDAGTRRTAFYTNVPPGHYVFRVVASNNAGVWNERGASVGVDVAPRFSETTLARVLAALALAIGGVAGYRWRVRRLRRRARELTGLVETRTAQLRAQEASLAQQNAQLAVQARRLAELDEAKSRLFANLSHEFRTPLTLIVAPLRGFLAGRHGPLSTDGREQAALMLRNAQRLLRLINQVLDLAKLDADQLALARGSGDLVAFVRDTTQAFVPLADGQGVSLTVGSAVAGLPWAFDAQQFEKVLFNLLSNALKFTGPHGTVTVDLTADDVGATIAVRDSGVGIDPADLAHVFDRFYQVDATTTRRYDGSGIGLALAREIVLLHGGTIRAESTPGLGSTFTIWLPRVAVASGAPTPSSDDVTPGVPAGARALVTVTPGAGQDTTGDRTTVLVVDDSPDVRAYVRAVLAPTYRVQEAVDGAAGLERARALLPDLIVADVMMPEVDGLALARALKQDPMTDAIPVVLLTARTTAADQVAGFEIGVDAYLTKPFDPAVLEACVAALLAQRRRLRARFVGQGTTKAAESAPSPAVGPGVVPADRADAAPSPPDPVSPATAAIVQRLRELVVARLTSGDLDPNRLAAAAGLSYHQMYRALREGCNVSPSRFVRGIRAECAAELLDQGAGSITEVAYAVGFESLSYFSRAFRERFGVAPSAYQTARPPDSSVRGSSADAGSGATL